jgi:parvulin-like peptidyl-prolyl isomerase
MFTSARLSLAVVVTLFACTAAGAQNPAPTPPAPPAAAATPPPPAPPPSTPTQAPPPATTVAATVNGQPIPELSVYRALLREPQPARRAALRPEVINFLVENALIDQYLEKLKIPVEAQEVEKRFGDLKEEIVKGGGDFKKVCETLYVTEADLRSQITCSLRFEKFANQYATDKALRDFFTANRAMFDGSQLKARHILLKVPAGDAQAAEQAKANLLKIKKLIEAQVAEGLKAVTGQDKLAQEKARIELLDKAFAEAAAKESACPSKSAGGELGWFPRSGRMVEPFAKAAFALKPYEMSDVVVTEFGLHLILATDQKPGRDVQYEKLQEVVKEVYTDRMREALLAQLRPSAQIVVNPPPAATPAAPTGKQ